MVETSMTLYAEEAESRPCISYFANTSWYLVNFRMGLLREVVRRGVDVIAIAPEDEYSGAFGEAGIPWHPVTLKRREYNPFQKMRAIRQVRRIYREQQVAIAHHFTLEAIIAGTVAASYTGGPAVVQSVTGLGIAFSSRSTSWRIVRSGLIPFLRRTLPRGEIIVENRMDEQRVAEILRPEARSRIRRIPGGGVDLTQFHPEGPSAFPREPGRVRFLMAGRLLREKGAGLYAEAARLLGDDRAEFWLAGVPDPGNPDSHSREDIAGWERIPGFRWLGKIDDMAGLLRSVDVLVHPTYYGEGLPRILMEAAATGLPLIGSPIPGCSEIIVPGENGWLMRERSAAELARLMAEALSSPDRAAFGRSSREQAVAGFGETVATRRTLEVYAGLRADLAANLLPHEPAAG